MIDVATPIPPISTLVNTLASTASVSALIDGRPNDRPVSAPFGSTEPPPADLPAVGPAERTADGDDTTDGDTPSEVDEATRWTDGECTTPLLVVETVPAPHCLTDPPFTTRNANLTAGSPWQASGPTGHSCIDDVASTSTPETTVLDSPVTPTTVAEQQVLFPVEKTTIPASRSTEIISPVQPVVGTDGMASGSVGTALLVQDNARDETLVVRNSDSGGTKETPPLTTTTITSSTPCHENVVGRGLTSSEEEGDTTERASRLVTCSNGSTDVDVNTPTRSQASAACSPGPREGSVVTPLRSQSLAASSEESISCTTRLPVERNSEFDESFDQNAVRALRPPISFGSEPVLTTARVSAGPSSGQNDWNGRRWIEGTIIGVGVRHVGRRN